MEVDIYKKMISSIETKKEETSTPGKIFFSLFFIRISIKCVPTGLIFVKVLQWLKTAICHRIYLYVNKII